MRYILSMLLMGLLAACSQSKEEIFLENPSNVTKTDDEVFSILYQNDEVQIAVPNKIYSMTKITINGANVLIDILDEYKQLVEYRLTGHSSNGSFVCKGECPTTVNLEGINLKSTIGPALDIKNKADVSLIVTDGTNNTLEDTVGGSHKGCLVSKGNCTLSGNGKLTVVGNTKQGIKAESDLLIHGGEIHITSQMKDGINTDGLFKMQGGIIHITTTGNGYWEEEELKTKSPSCINAETGVKIMGGELYLQSSGDGGKGIDNEGEFVMSGGSIDIITTGCRYIDPSYEHLRHNPDAIPDSLCNSPKALKTELGLTVNEGTIRIRTEKDGGEGMESKASMILNGGSFTIDAFDDCLNAAGDIIITGGNYYLSSKDNDGIDTNSSLYIQGGNIVTLGSHNHELGMDVNDKGRNKKLYVTGGTVVSIGSGTTYTPHPYTCSNAQPCMFFVGKIPQSELSICDDTGKELFRYTHIRNYAIEAGGQTPKMCMMLTSPNLIVGKAYMLINRKSGEVIAFVNSLNQLYSDME